MKLEEMQGLYPKFYEHLDKELLSKTEFYYYRQLYEIFEKLGMVIVIDYDKKYEYKIIPKPGYSGFIFFKSNFETRENAELSAFETLIKKFENEN